MSGAGRFRFDIAAFFKYLPVAQSVCAHTGRSQRETADIFLAQPRNPLE